MIIGISGKAQSGKDTVARMINIYKFRDSSKNNFDTISEEYLLKKLNNDYFDNYYFKKHSFADILKECAALILSCDINDFYTTEGKNSLSGVTVREPTLKSHSGLYSSDIRTFELTKREILQRFGNALRKEISPNIWVDALLKQYDNECNQYVEYGTTQNGDRIPIGMNYLVPLWVIPDVRYENEANALKKKNTILIRVENPNIKKMDHISETDLDNYDKFDYVINNNGTLLDLYKQVEDIMKKIRETPEC